MKDAFARAAWSRCVRRAFDCAELRCDIVGTTVNGLSCSDSGVQDSVGVVLPCFGLLVQALRCLGPRWQALSLKLDLSRVKHGNELCVSLHYLPR